MIKRLKFWWFRKRNRYPCVQEINQIMRHAPRLSLKTLGVAMVYSINQSIEETAIYYNYTQERVIQILMKIYRSSKDVDRKLR